MRTADGYRPPAVPYHTPVRVRLPPRTSFLFGRNAQYYTNTETPVRAARKEVCERIRFAQLGRDSPTLDGRQMICGRGVDDWHEVPLFAIILPCPAERVSAFSVVDGSVYRPGGRSLRINLEKAVATARVPRAEPISLAEARRRGEFESYAGCLVENGFLPNGEGHSS